MLTRVLDRGSQAEVRWPGDSAPSPIAFHPSRRQTKEEAYDQQAPHVGDQMRHACVWVRLSDRAHSVSDTNAWAAWGEKNWAVVRGRTQGKPERWGGVRLDRALDRVSSFPFFSFLFPDFFTTLLLLFSNSKSKSSLKFRIQIYMHQSKNLICHANKYLYYI